MAWEKGLHQKQPAYQELPQAQVAQVEQEVEVEELEQRVQRRVQGGVWVKYASTDCFCSSSRKRIAAYVLTPCCRDVPLHCGSLHFGEVQENIGNEDTL